MRLVRTGIVGAAVLLALHVFMLAGIDIGHPSPVAITVTLHHGEAQDGAAVAPSTRGHSMALACLTVLAGLLLWDMLSAVTQRRLQPLDLTPPAAPVRSHRPRRPSRLGSPGPRLPSRSARVAHARSTWGVDLTCDGS